MSAAAVQQGRAPGRGLAHRLLCFLHLGWTQKRSQLWQCKAPGRGLTHQLLHLCWTVDTIKVPELLKRAELLDVDSPISCFACCILDTKTVPASKGQSCWTWTQPSAAFASFICTGHENGDSCCRAEVLDLEHSSAALLAAYV